jgi:hypothetical protein
MKKLFYVIVLCLSTKSFAQTAFYSGFEAGYKAGYCYGRPSCVAPIVPNAPVTTTGGISYQDGYNSGFQMGLDKQRSIENNTSSGYKGTPATFIEGAMFKLPYELMMKVIDKKDKEFENKYGSIENRDRIFKELLLKGLDAFNNKDYYGAINFCNQAEETLLTNPMIDFILGGSYYSIGDYDNSLRHLKTAKNNGYTDADEYIKLIKKKEKEMTYERPIKFGVKIGYNINSLKSSPVAGLFMQGRSDKWGIKNFSILTELQFFQAQYNQEIEAPYLPSGKYIYVIKDNILQTNLLFKNSLNKRIALVYGIGMSAGLESQSIMFDINAGFQYHFSQYFFTECRYNRNLTRSYFLGDGIVVYEPNNFNVSLGYKF